jgi:hypothetical protein
MTKQQLLESTRAMPEKVQASVIGRLHRTLVASHALSIHRTACTTALKLLAQVLQPRTLHCLLIHHLTLRTRRDADALAPTARAFGRQPLQGEPTGALEEVLRRLREVRAIMGVDILQVVLCAQGTQKGVRIRVGEGLAGPALDTAFELEPAKSIAAYSLHRCEFPPIPTAAPVLASHCVRPKSRATLSPARCDAVDNRCCITTLASTCATTTSWTGLRVRCSLFRSWMRFAHPSLPPFN